MKHLRLVSRQEMPAPLKEGTVDPEDFEELPTEDDLNWEE